MPRRYTHHVRRNAPPERYFLTLTETSRASGFSQAELLRRRKSWCETGTGLPPEPVFFGPNGNGPVKYRIDDIRYYANTTFLERMQRKLAEYLSRTASATPTETEPLLKEAV